VINKTYTDLVSDVILQNYTPNGQAWAFLYSANTTGIEQQTNGITITPPANGGTTSVISSYTFPAQSITLLIIPPHL